MDLNKQFGELFDNILDSNKYRKKMLKLIQKFHNEKIINLNFTLCLIKSLLILLSVRPEKCKFYFKIFKLLDNSNIIIKNNIKEISENISFVKNTNLLDEDIESIIFITIKLFKSGYFSCKEQIYSIFYQIIKIIIKLDKLDMKTKMFLYKKLIIESIKIIKKFNTKSYLKIVELSGNTYKIINEYLLI
tara:strand:- start:39 stop:605 length:567 start_codon:yes stop_codon:yes gene_type:complete